MKFACILVLAMVVAGCTSSTPLGESDGSPVDRPDANSMEQGDAHSDPADDPRTRQAQYSDCRGWRTALYYGPEMNPGSTPPEWQPDIPHPYSNVIVHAWECQRLSVGPFERGPVAFILEMHNNLRTPSECLQGQETLVGWMLHRLWIDDGEIAAFLQEHHRMPAATADISIAREAAPNGEITTWDWTIEGSTSTVNILHVDPSDEEDMTDIRVFWQDGQGAGTLHFDIDVDGPSFTTRLAWGEFNAPMLAQDRPIHGAQGDRHRGDLVGTFQHYEDMQCAQPSWPPS